MGLRRALRSDDLLLARNSVLSGNCIKGLRLLLAPSVVRAADGVLLLWNLHDALEVLGHHDGITVSLRAVVALIAWELVAGHVSISLCQGRRAYA